MLMGVWYLANFAGNYLSGYLGTFWEKMPRQEFFLMLTVLLQAGKGGGMGAAFGGGSSSGTVFGGSGAGIVRYESLDQLRDWAAEGMVPDSIDKVWLVQDFVPARGGRIMRFEILDGRFLLQEGVAKSQGRKLATAPERRDLGDSDEVGTPLGCLRRSSSAAFARR